MRNQKTVLRAVSLFAILTTASIASAVPPGGSPYAPYAFLIGQWDVAPEGGGAPTARSVLRWGPKQSYIWYATSLLEDGAEKPHFEGMLVWNAVRKNLDMLLALDLEGGGRMQEQGTVSIQADGTVVREITAYSAGSAANGSGGTAGHFRQTFKAVGPDRVLTTVMRETAQGWVATFPGSDHLVMIRRKDSAGA